MCIYNYSFERETFEVDADLAAESIYVSDKVSAAKTLAFPTSHSYSFSSQW